MKQLAGYVFAGAMLSISAIPTARAADASVVVNNEKLTVQRPTMVLPPATTAPSGITYKATGATGPQDPKALLTVYTEGFLFCANVGAPSFSEVELIPGHETEQLSQDVPSMHRWTFPTAKDIAPFRYAGGTLSVNYARVSSLVCHGVGSVGDVPSGLAEVIFSNAFDGLSPTRVNYENLVNWKSSLTDEGWKNSENWGVENAFGVPIGSTVPFNPCAADDDAQAEEDVVCAAVTGVRKVDVSGATKARRAPTMWTAVTSQGTQFSYVFRVDGVQVDPAAADAKIAVRDAFDSTYLGAAGATYCLRQSLPLTLDGSVCANAPSFSGTLNIDDATLGNVDGQGNAFTYVVVTRSIVGNAPGPNSTIPVVGAAIFVSPEVTGPDVGGDKFSGDDVVFGFMPQSKGFSWMNWQ